MRLVVLLGMCRGSTRVALSGMIIGSRGIILMSRLILVSRLDGVVLSSLYIVGLYIVFLV